MASSSSLEGNKLISAVLVAGIVGVGSAVLSGILYQPHELAEPVYKIALPEPEAPAGEEVAAAEAQPIGVLLASADVAAGEGVAKKCTACHSFDAGGANKVGPGLHGIVGREIGKHEGFAYSEAMAGKGGTWDYEALNGFLLDPKGWLPGTKMSFAGLGKEKDRADVIAYLRSITDNPPPLPAAEAPAAEAPAAEPAQAAAAAAEATPPASGEQPAASGEQAAAEPAPAAPAEQAAAPAEPPAAPTEQVAAPAEPPAGQAATPAEQPAAAPVVEAPAAPAQPPPAEQAAAPPPVEQAPPVAAAPAEQTPAAPPPAEQQVAAAPAEPAPAAVPVEPVPAAAPAEQAPAAAPPEPVQQAAVDPATTTATPSAAPAAAAAGVAGLAALLASGDPAAGQAAARKCGACHSFTPDGKNKVGPGLHGVVGRPIGKHEGFNYSQAMAGHGGNWDYEALNAYLASPKTWLPGNKMAFAGLAKEKERADVIAYLRSITENAPPLPGS